MADLGHNSVIDVSDVEMLRRALVAIVGADNVRNDNALRALHSQDIWSVAPGVVALVVSPSTVEHVSQIVAATAAAGFAIAPRGAGMSYTGGYLPASDRTISLDMAQMSRIVAIRPDDMVVTVQAGCTWAALHAALAPLGLRTPFWGPVSGMVATVGGGISQRNAFYGAGHYGNSSESVVALTVVLADGAVLRTGARGPGGDLPFYRYYGPDLAGLFCGDCGVFGIKTEITLRLIRAPAHEDGASFAFETGDAMVRAAAEMTRAGVACEMCGFDPGLTKIRLKRSSVAGDIKTLGAVIARQKSPFKGLMSATRIALSGRSFIESEAYSLHVICEGRSKAAVADDIAEARRIAAAFGGRIIENTIAKVMRAVPFGPLNTILGPQGERWVPTHGQAPLSQAPAILADIHALFAEMADAFDAAGITTGMLFSNLSTNALVMEPIFLWPDAHFAIHEATIEPATMTKLPDLAPTPQVTELVAATRKRLIAIFERYGCAHFQIGRTYPYKASCDTPSWQLLEALKTTLDPETVMNPGVLGFTPGRP